MFDSSVIISFVLPVSQAERPHEAVARQLRAAILDGTYLPGDRLPVERELSERFEVSRSAVRQALLILDQQGLIRVKAGVGGGPFVAREPVPAAVTAFENLLTTDEFSIEEFLQAKVVIEPAIAEYAVQAMSESDLDRLRDNVTRTRDAVERGDDTTSLAVEFHTILFHSTSNRFLEVVLEILSRTFERLPASTVESAQQEGVVDDHQHILDAISKGATSEVRELMEKHLLRVWEPQLEPMRRETDPARRLEAT